MSNVKFTRRIANWPRKLWARVRPGKRAVRGASWSSALAAAVIGAWLATRIRGVHGLWVDMAIGAGIALLGSLLVWPLLVLAMGTLRRTTEVIGRIGVGALVALAVLLDESGLARGPALMASVAIIVPVALAIGSIGAITGSGWRRAGVLRRGWLALCLVAGLGATGWLAWWVMSLRGSSDHIVTVPHRAESDLPAPLGGADPGAPGPATWKTLTYGAGTDRHRPEYGEEVDLKTGTVNAKPFTKLPTGFKGRLRSDFWGIDDAGHLPLNARVWYPEGDGPYPLVLCVHGNHHMADWSDPGYAYLGELLASKGYIFCSVDENFLNGSVIHGGMRGENDARAWILLKHLELWRKWSTEDGHPFQGKVDLDNIGLIGHSRGGEAVGHAAVFNRLKRWPDDASVRFDFGFAIKGIVGIAPCDGQYRPADRFAVTEDVSLLLLHGGHDADVSSFSGDRLFRRAKVSGDQFKASVYVYRANHGQFNTVWGDTDQSGPVGLLLNREALIPGEQQRQIARVMIGAFLDTVLKGKREYVPLFRDVARARDWIPDTPVVTRYEDATFEVVADYEEDVDVESTTVKGGAILTSGFVVMREGDRKMRGGRDRRDHAAWLGWNQELAEESAPPATYTIKLPKDFAQSASLGLDSALVFNLAAADQKPKPKDYSTDEDDDQSADANTAAEDPEAEDEPEEDAEENEDTPLDLTVELVASDGTTARVPLSRFGVIAPPLKAKMSRWGATEKRYGGDVECVLQTYEIPLAAFAGTDSTVTFDALTEIRFVFDRCPKGVIVLDRVGFAKR